jgi:hypothetical protein
MEPARESNPDSRLTKAECSPLSLSRHVDRWPGRTRTCVASPGSRPGGPCRQSNRPSRAVIRCRPGPPALQGQGHGRVRRRCVRSAGFEPAKTWLSTRPVYQLRHEHSEPPPGVEPGHPPYEGGAASRARRRSCPPWIRTTTAGFRVRRPTVRPMGIEVWSGAPPGTRTPNQRIKNPPL